MSFVHDLSAEDLRKLREIVKRTHLRFYPTDRINDYEADKLIDALGPEVAGKMVKEAVDRKLIT